MGLNGGVRVGLLIDALGEAIVEVQVEIEGRLTPFEEPLALLQIIPGIKPIAAATIVADVGTDMSRYPEPDTWHPGQGSAQPTKRVLAIA